MKYVGIISDTHGVLDMELFDFFSNCEQIWHCGDIGNLSVIQELEQIAPVVAVYGNIDDQRVKRQFAEYVVFHFDGVQCVMTHIGGYPGKYSPLAIKLLQIHKPTVFLCGHSHILRVQYDKQYQCLYVNPGAAGNTGIHVKKTALKIAFADGKPAKLTIWEKNK